MSKKINRYILDAFHKKVKPNKVLILLGARRVGKTELIKSYLEKYEPSDFQFLNGEDQKTVQLFLERSVSNYTKLFGKTKLLVIDEAQKIPEIGLNLKLIVDEIKDISIIATGSSMFDLSNKLGEPLVGRESTLKLFPLAQLEFKTMESPFETNAALEERLIFGGYPELINHKTSDEKADYLESIVNSYLLRDILEFEGIRKSDKIMDLLRLIAFQVGKEINIEELASNLKGVSRNTIENYLDLLSKVFIIYNVRGFSRNLRKEIAKTSRWYFFDNGIRNAIIRNFNPLNLRNDVGDLWENYLAAERIKKQHYLSLRTNNYFWRTYDQQEIDWVEESADRLDAFEFKWNPKKKLTAPGAWKKTYPHASYSVVTPENYLDFIT